LGLLRMLVDDGDRNPRQMADALRRLPGQKTPSQAKSVAMLNGLDRVGQLTRRWIETRHVSAEHRTA
jgi:predicted glycosyltransferase